MANKNSYDPLAQARRKPKLVKTLAVNPAGARNAGLGLFEPYPAFPKEILACKNLEQLEIFRGIDWNGDATIPKGIGTLKKLTKLELGGIACVSLPAEVGKLAKLESLSLSYATELRSLPAELGKLRALRELSCCYCESLVELPPEIGKLRKLRSLDLRNTNLHTVPKELWQCKALEALYLPDSIRRLPKGIGGLRKLARLSLSAAAAAHVASELPKLPKLSSLHMSGKASVLPAQIGKLPKLVELDLAYIGLTALPPLTLGKLAKLAIAGNQITSVKPLLAQLPKLVELDYLDNPVDTKERREVDKLMKLPPAKRKRAVADAEAAAAGDN